MHRSLLVVGFFVVQNTEMCDVRAKFQVVWTVREQVEKRQISGVTETFETTLFTSDFFP